MADYFLDRVQKKTRLISDELGCREVEGYDVFYHTDRDTLREFVPEHGYNKFLEKFNLDENK